MERPIGFVLDNILASARARGRSAGFVAALGFTLPHEGIVFEIVPGDAGGATCCGITQVDYDQYRNEIVAPHRSVQQITALEVADCYYRHYWAALGCDNWQQPVALAMFDSAVNVGVKQAVKFLQRSCGVTADGALGNNTQAAEHDYVVKHGPAALATAIIGQRRAFYVALADEHENDAQFLEGWLNRCNDLMKAISVTATAKGV